MPHSKYTNLNIFSKLSQEHILLSDILRDWRSVMKVMADEVGKIKLDRKFTP